MMINIEPGDTTDKKYKTALMIEIYKVHVIFYCTNKTNDDDNNNVEIWPKKCLNVFSKFAVEARDAI